MIALTCAHGEFVMVSRAVRTAASATTLVAVAAALAVVVAAVDFACSGQIAVAEIVAAVIAEHMDACHAS